MSASGQIVRFPGDLLKLIAALLIATAAVDTAFWFLEGMHGGFFAYPYTQGRQPLLVPASSLLWKYGERCDYVPIESHVLGICETSEVFENFGSLIHRHKT